MTDIDRETFENAATALRYDMTRGHTQRYAFENTQQAWILWKAATEQSSARIAELEKEAERRSQLATPSDFNREQLKFANATIEELRRKLAEQKSEGIKLAIESVARYCATTEVMKLSTARAEGHAQAMKEVSETPTTVWKYSCYGIPDSERCAKMMHNQFDTNKPESDDDWEVSNVEEYIRRTTFKE
jgi:hypothetical protein